MIPGSPQRALLPALLLLSAGACTTGPRPVEGAIDPRVYSECQDPEGAAAWQRGQWRLRHEL